MKNILYKVSIYSEPYSYNVNKIKVQLDQSKYATKSDVKNITGVDTSKFTGLIQLF